MARTLANPVVIVTGASSALARRWHEWLAERGARLGLIARRQAVSAYLEGLRLQLRYRGVAVTTICLARVP